MKTASEPNEESWQPCIQYWDKPDSFFIGKKIRYFRLKEIRVCDTVDRDRVSNSIMRLASNSNTHSTAINCCEILVPKPADNIPKGWYKCIDNIHYVKEIGNGDLLEVYAVPIYMGSPKWNHKIYKGREEFKPVFGQGKGFRDEAIKECEEVYNDLCTNTGKIKELEDAATKPFLQWAHRQELGFQEWKSNEFGTYQFHFLITVYGHTPDRYYCKLELKQNAVLLESRRSLTAQQAQCEDFVKEFLKVLNP